MGELGHVLLRSEERASLERVEPNLRRLALRRDGAWLTFADEAGFDRRTLRADPPTADIDAWGEYLSRALDRSVLTVWTSESEASVRATRWKRGKTRGRLTLLDQAYRGPDGFPYAPSKVLWPWLPRARREQLLASGIKLVTPSGGSTGDPELDALLEGFDESDHVESDGGDEDDGGVFVSEDISVRAIGAAIGMTRPLLNPSFLDEADEALVFARTTRTS